MESLAPWRKHSIESLAEFLGAEYAERNVVDLNAIGESENLEIFFDHYERAFDGMLVLDRDQFHIHLDIDGGNGPGRPRGRFSLAHELGHYFIDEHRIGLKSGQLTPHASKMSLGSAALIEREANHFASCLLMPAAAFREALPSHAFSANTIDAVSAIFKTSFTAALLRYFTLGSLDAMAVFSKDGVVRWFASTPGFDLGRFGFRVNEPLPSGSVASQMRRGEMVTSNEVHRIEAHEWFHPHSGWALREINEQCIHQPELGYTISLLWLDASLG